jgi:hypothetical protein
MATGTRGCVETAELLVVAGLTVRIAGPRTSRYLEGLFSQFPQIATQAVRVQWSGQLCGRHHSSGDFQSSPTW